MTEPVRLDPALRAGLLRQLERYARKKDRPAGGQLAFSFGATLPLARDNCGTGAGGFQAGNTCATGKKAEEAGKEKPDAPFALKGGKAGQGSLFGSAPREEGAAAEARETAAGPRPEDAPAAPPETGPKAVPGKPPMMGLSVPPSRGAIEPPAPATPEPTVEPKTKATPEPVAAEAPRGTFDPANHIKIAADSVERLRRPDVFRVLDWAPEVHRGEMAAYLAEHRPDLADEVREVSEELGIPAGSPPEAPARYSRAALKSAVARHLRHSA